MKNFVISNKSGEPASINIFGDIGQGFFEEGNTIESVTAAVQKINADEIDVNINSLGGDLNHGLAIHDMLKMHKAKITTKITGMTASAGTVIAMAGDERKMSENAMFLVHNAEARAQGNQHDLRKTLEILEQADDIMINIYKNSTGKSVEDISSLMKEAKWISAEEAESFGFIDSQFEPVAIAASVKKINESDLPKVPETILSKIESMSIKEDFDAFKTSVNAKIDSIVASIAGKADDNKEVTVLDNEEVTGLISDFENKVSEAVDSLQESNETIEAHVATIAGLNAKVTELEAEVAKNAATPTTVAAVDGDPSGTPAAKSEWAKVADQIKSVMHK